MEKRNVWENVPSPLEMHVDTRGKIVDIFFNVNIKHVAIVDTIAGSRRGDHYHAKSTQHMIMIKGSMEYWFKPLNSEEAPQCVVMKEGDIVTTRPYEIHTLRYREAGTFIVFSEGVRGGSNYEKDTIRVTPLNLSD